MAKKVKKYLFEIKFISILDKSDNKESICKLISTPAQYKNDFKKLFIGNILSVQKQTPLYGLQ